MRHSRVRVPERSLQPVHKLSRCRGDSLHAPGHRFGPRGPFGNWAGDQGCWHPLRPSFARLTLGKAGREEVCGLPQVPLLCSEQVTLLEVIRKTSRFAFYSR